MKSIIIGHNNPDTDSVVASLILVDFLKRKKFDFLKNYQFEAKTSGKINQETKFILNYFKQEKPGLIKSVKNKKVFLVDHGEVEKSAPGIEQAELLGVLDHHKISGLSTAYPLYYRAEPVGSTCTILTKMFEQNNIKINKKQAGLLLAGVLSDTINLSSPTTTKQDKKAVKTLTKISQVDKNSLGKKILEIKSDISNISSLEIVKKDYKDFQVGKNKCGIAVLETLNPAKVKERDINSVLKKIKKEKKLDLIYFSLIDILKNNTELYLLEEVEKITAEKAFKKKARNNILFLPQVSSRKKQIAPPLINYLEKK